METNPFLQQLTNLAVEIANNVDLIKKPMLGFSPSRPLLKHEQYVHNCFLSLAEVEGLITQLNTAAVLLASFRNSPTLKINKISRYEYMVYHIESHLLRVTGVIDRLLIFVNTVLEIGLPDVKCKAHFMLEDQKNKKGKYAVDVDKVPKLYFLLMNLLRYIDRFRDDRNTIAHSKKIAYDDLRRIEMYHLVNQPPADARMEPFAFLIKHETDKKVKEYKGEILRCNQEIKDLIAPIYQLLESEFHQRHNVLKKLNAI